MRFLHIAVVHFILFSCSVAVAGPITNLKAWEEKKFGAPPSDPVTLVVTCNVAVNSDDTPELREAAGGSDPKILQLNWIRQPPSGQSVVIWKRVWFEKQVTLGKYSEVEVEGRKAKIVQCSSNFCAD